MTQKRTPSARRPSKKGGKLIPALCNIIGTLILIAVIASAVPLTVPRLLGYEIYNVESGSMEPALPVGSVVYVEHTSPENVEAGDIIAYNVDGTVVTHRVVENYFVEGEYVTKGDANPMEDFDRVRYRDLIGKVKYHIPVAGRYLTIYSQQITKVYLLCLAACGVMFNMLAGIIRKQHEEKFRQQLERYDRRQEAKMRAKLDEVRK